MKPPNSDANRPGSPSAGQPGKPATPGTDPAGKPGTPGNVEASAPKVGQDGVKTDALKTEAAKAEILKAETGKPDAAKPDAAKSDAGKPDAGKPDAAKPEAPKAEAFKADAPKSGAFGGGTPGGARPNTSVTDGPIIDLKAKRLPDPVPPAKPTAPGAASGVAAGMAGKTADPKAQDPKPSDAKSSEPKPLDAKPTSPGDAAAKPPGSTTPRISPAAAAAPVPAPRGPGFGSLATAGLLGGVIGAGLLFGVERSGLLHPGEDGRLAALDQRIAALAPKDAVAGLDKRVAANEAALKSVPDAVATARQALERANAAQGSAPAAAEGSAPPAALPADLVARLDALDQRVSALQEEPGRDQGGDTRLAVAPSGPSTAQVGALEDRLKALEGKVDGAPKSAPVPDLTPKLAALQGDVEARTRANAEAAQALSQKVTALQQSLEARIQAATESVQAATQASEKVADAGKAQAAEAAKAVERQLQAQADRIAGLDKAVSERAETATLQAALRVVSADRIVTALNTGAPYADALAALRGLEPGDPARLTAVAAFADKGAPTARSLAAEFRPIAEKIAASRRAAQTRAVAETGDIGTKLMSMAESIVQVRRVESQGSGSAAQPAPDTTPKVQEALDRGAIKEAAEAFAALPEAARTEAGEFGIKLRSRAAAGDAAQGLLAEAFKGLPATGTSR
ncbi:COG4223 family protein [Methylobacterium flocculans]|uniref:COG4223 family protein n=1 Tax=Methylobacterium flocculans TaxID=2984843 RepID=UPI0021F29F88|nr:hypothetical protein [Methylobacterium sp. FF17]